MIACPDCDLLLHVAPPAQGMLAQCPRCGAVLRRAPVQDRQRQWALTLTAALLFALANLFPIVSLEAKGQRVSCTLVEAVGVLWQGHSELVALLVLLTAGLVPGAEIVLMLAALWRPRAWMLRLIALARPWAMIDVFVLGLLVSARKLADMATLLPGVAFWSFAALMLLLASLRGQFHLHDFWDRMPLRHG
jgi:paraquat-inducible protein A